MLGAGGGVAIEELLLELMAQCLGFLFDNGCLQVLYIATGCLEVVINIGIASQDFEGGGGLGKGGCRLDPGIADVIEIDGRKGSFPGLRLYPYKLS